MIHAKQYRKEIFDKHGSFFVSEMNRINSLNIEGIKVTITGDTRKYGISQEKNKRILTIITKIRNKTLFAVIPTKYFDNSLIMIIAYNHEKGYWNDTKLVWAQYADTYRIPQSRKGIIKLYSINDAAIAEQIEKNSQLIMTGEEALEKRQQKTFSNADSLKTSFF